MNSLYEPLLLEIAWEVCNKVGGIYTVIQSKVPYMRKRWGDQYCLIGPITGDSLPIEFQPAGSYDDSFGRAVLALRAEGIKIEYGYWLVAGKPKVVLLPIEQLRPKAWDIKIALYQKTGIQIPDHDDLALKVTMFGELINMFLNALSEPSVNDKQIIAHFHEWMAASHMSLINDKNIATIFTTHATSLGRFVAMNDNNFYRNLPRINWEEEAEKYGIVTQTAIERKAAHSAHILTTVSQVTDKECEFLLGRKADVILPNGLNINRFEALHELQNLHLKYKKQINDFVMGHFFNNYTFDLDKTLYFFTSGRYEPVNKGYDLTLEALYRLNQRMKRANIDMTVIMFFITKRPYHSINPLVLQLRSLIEEVKQTCHKIQEQIGEKLYYKAVQNGEDFTLPNLNKLVDEYWQFRYKKTLLSWKTPYLPIVVTHNLVNDQDDEILKFVREKEFFNQEADPVKIVYHPDFIDSTSPLFKLDYYQFVRGTHLGVFPSYYEPWGYTPVECLVRGIPTITSDLAGFGDYAKEHVRNLSEGGVYVVNRRNQDFDQAAEQLTDYLFDFVQKNRRERIALRNSVESNAVAFSWDSLGKHYLEAYRLAMNKLEELST